MVKQVGVLALHSNGTTCRSHQMHFKTGYINRMGTFRDLLFTDNISINTILYSDIDHAMYTDVYHSCFNQFAIYMVNAISLYMCIFSYSVCNVR